MGKLTIADLKPLDAYEETRRAFQSFVGVLQRDRRVGLGPWVSLLFENRQTVLFQLQELLRAARISDPDRVQQEIDAFNQLLPEPEALSATMLVAVTGPESLDAVRAQLAGIESAVVLKIGDKTRIRSTCDTTRSRHGATAIIHYLRLEIGNRDLRALRDGKAPAVLSTELDGYAHETELWPECRRSLAADLGPKPKDLDEKGDE